MKLRKAIIAFGLIFVIAAGALSAQQRGGAFLGVRVEDTSDGVTIREVVNGSPASASLQVGDIITAVNGEAIATVEELATAIQGLNAGDSATLTITRAGEGIETEVTLGSTPPMMDGERGQGQGGGQGDGQGQGGGRSNDGAPFMHMIQSIILYTPNGEWEVRQLTEESPLYAAGLRRGDVITAFDGAALDQAGVQALVTSNASEMVVLTVTRDGTEQEIEVPAAAISAFYDPMRMEGGRPVDPRYLMPAMGMNLPTNGRLGVAFVTLDEQRAAENDVEFVEGALIQSVEADSPAAAAGIVEGDIVTAVNGEPVDFERTLRDRILAYEPGDVVTLTILRAGEAQDIEVTLVELRPEDYGMGEFHLQIMPPGAVPPEVERTPEPMMPEATAAPGA